VNSCRWLLRSRRSGRFHHAFPTGRTLRYIFNRRVCVTEDNCILNWNVSIIVLFLCAPDMIFECFVVYLLYLDISLIFPPFGGGLDYLHYSPASHRWWQVIIRWLGYNWDTLSLEDRITETWSTISYHSRPPMPMGKEFYGTIRLETHQCRLLWGSKMWWIL
jgi:hypothetical protein